MRLAAVILPLAGGLIALLTVALVFFVVADAPLAPQLGLAALFALVIIALALLEFGSRYTRNAGAALIVLSVIALALSHFSAVFALRPLLFGYALSLIGGILALFVVGRVAAA